MPVPDSWLQSAVERTLSAYRWNNELCLSDCDQYLALSKTTIPHPWKRISVKTCQKSDELISGLPDGPLMHSPETSSSLHGHLSEINRDNYLNLWAKKHYDVQPKQTTSHKQLQKVQFFIHKYYWKRRDMKCNVLQQYLERLYPEQMADLKTSRQSSVTHISPSPCSLQNILHVIKIYETDDAFYLIQPFVLHNIQNVIAFSPAVFKSSMTKPLFVLYQLLHLLNQLHKKGLILGNVSLHDVLCDEKLWIYTSGLQFKNILEILQSKQNQPPEIVGKDNLSSRTTRNQNVKSEIHVDSKKILNSQNTDIFNDASNSHRIHSDQDHSDVSIVREYPMCSRLFCESDSLVEDARTFLQSDYTRKFSVHNLPTLVEDWVHKRITNFKYLMVLNHLAGRRMSDPNNHPILPWVMEFSSTEEEFDMRDLTKSKYRLTKGDNQLDLTFESHTFFKDNIHIPHHVSDILSDITYYVYKARRTPKSILCSHVRPKWVPNEYPLSMMRMYNWSPDECIPEFYTDPLIFSSIHEDLPDLELPVWCSTPEEFIVKHMEVLESDKVSVNLHQWIDLTFGFKLSGIVAVKEKNINLQLVDDHKNITNHGVVQLFTEPHPYRITKQLANKPEPPKIAKNVLWSQMHGLEEAALPGDRRIGSFSQTAQRPETATVILPKYYDPLASLSQLEVLYNLTSHNMGQIPPKQQQEEENKLPDNAAHVMRDMYVFGCLMCELFLQPVLYMEESNAPLHKRWKLICKYCTENTALVPRSIQRAVEILLNMERYRFKPDTTDFTYPVITSAGMSPPTPSQLLCPSVSILPFPDYFPLMYETICKLKDIDRKLEKIGIESQSNLIEKQKLLKVTAREKVTVMQKYLEKIGGTLNEEGIELLLPHIEELFANEDTSVQAAWSLFNLLGLEIDSNQMKRQFLPYLVKLYHVDNPTPKYMKIYHKSFIVQLILRLGLDSFLSNFSTTLVEAVAGYKDYVFEDLYTEQSDMESFLEKNQLHLPVLKEENGKLGTSPGQSGTSLSENCNSNMRTPDDVDDIEDEIGDDGSRDLDNQSNSGESLNDAERVSLQSFDEDKRKDYEDKESVNSLSAANDYEDEEEEENILQFQVSEEVEEEEVSSGPDREDKGRGCPDDQYLNKKPIITNMNNNGPGMHMIRSETDEFAKTMSDRTASEVVNIRDVSMETIKWLSHRIGPFLTAKYLSRNLLRMMVLCYLGEEQLMSIEDKEDKLKTSRYILGDRHAEKVIGSLMFIAQLYGEQVILLQYIPSIVDIVYVAKKRLTNKAEAGLVSSLVLLRHSIPLLSDTRLMDILKETIVKEILQQVIRVVSSPSHNFPSGSTMRTVICHKFIDVVYILGIRIGFEMTRQHMTKLLQNFFVCFNPVNDTQGDACNSPQTLKHVKSNASMDDYFCNIKIDDSTQEYTIGTPVSMMSFTKSLSPQISPLKRRQPHSLSTSSDDKDESSEATQGKDVKKEMEGVFNSELAMASYIPFCRIFGSIHMEKCLPNEDLIRQLCSQYDNTLGETNGLEETENSTKTDETNVELLGNKIKLQQEKNQPALNFELMSIGPIHRNSKILSLDPELTKRHGEAQEKTFKGNWLAYWEHELGLSERDTLFNFKQIKLQTFEGHNGSIKTLTTLDNENSFISSSKDRTVKLWSVKSCGDGVAKIRCHWTYREHKKSIYSIVFLESVRLVASCDSSVHIWDPFTQDIVRNLDSNRYSPVTAMASLPAPSTMVLTANTDSQLRFLDLRTVGYAHEYRCSTASAVKVWNADDIKDVFILKGHTEPVHCISLYKNQVLTATTGNKIGVHSTADEQAMFTSEKMRSDTFKVY
ncbi:WDR81 [Mytilus edulis]|uniref:WDR81 n=1 Tax=Mytilus edulis TaxID=6550 RepID=A0A8S3SZ70_MYTED|nr:WDR81 [Mytilus edulis]